MNTTLFEILRSLYQMKHPAPSSLLRRHGYVYEGNVVAALAAALSRVFAASDPVLQRQALKTALELNENSEMEDVALCAAFIQEGLMRGGQPAYDRLLKAWGKGCIELVMETSRYAELAAAMADQAEREKVTFPGVYVYEVCTPFGMWFAEYVEKYGQAPEENRAMHMLAGLVREFFKPMAQGGAALDLEVVL